MSFFQSVSSDLNSAPSGSAPSEAAPAPQPSPFRPANDGSGDVIWGDETEQSSQAETSPDPKPSVVESGQDEELLSLLAEIYPQEAQPRAQQAAPEPASWQQSPQQQMPEHFDSNLLDTEKVKLYEQQLNLYFDQMGRNAQFADPQSAAAYHQAVQVAQGAAVQALKMKAEYSKMVALAHQMYGQFSTLQREMEPFRRVQAAKMLAERFGVTDFRKLLKNPTTGNAITNPAAMMEIAALLGEQNRQAAVGNRQGVDRPVAAVGSRSGNSRSIADLDPHSKEFAEIEAAVQRGQHIRLIS